jgi:protein-disulfide isomerase
MGGSSASHSVLLVYNRFRHLLSRNGFRRNSCGGKPRKKNDPINDILEVLRMDIEEVDTTPIVPEQKTNNRVRIFWVLGLIFAFAVGLGAGYLIWARPLKAELKLAQESAAKAAETAQQAAQQDQAAQDPNQQQEVKRYDVPVDDDPIRGSDSATITIIEFSDYQCPFCRQWHENVLPQLQTKYGDKIRMVYRDFPLYSIHPSAESAAIAANCAGEQKHYWEFGDLLFTHQDSLNTQTYDKLAEDLKLDLPSFKQCISENRYKDEVTADYNFASELGVRSTPTFFINGLAVVGAQPFEVFEQIIDMELAGKIP